MTADQTARNVELYGYVPVERPRLRRGERIALDRLVRPGAEVLDVGSGAGRISLSLLERVARVSAVDLSEPALEALRQSVPADAPLEVVHADARDLPFENDRFDLAVFAWNGIDWIHPEEERERAVREIARVLKPGGYFLFSSHNPVGALFTWRSPGSLKMWRWRMAYARRGDVRKRFFRNPDGLLLYHAAPRRVINRVREVSPLEPAFVIGSSGLSESAALLTVFSAWPYYAFRKGEA